MAGRIARIFRNVESLPDGVPNPDFVEGAPLVQYQYLAQDDDEGQRFSTDRGLAIVFPSHGSADFRAEELRIERPDLGFVFGVACVVDLPQVVSASPQSATAPRRSRRERIEEEMRADDLRALEEVEVYS